MAAFLDAWLELVEDAAAAIPGSAPLWVLLYVAARLAYVGYIGYWLHAQDRRGALTARWGDQAQDKFARRGSWLMNVDGVVLGVATGKHAGEIGGAHPLLFFLGVALIVFGIVITILSARALGLRAWLWGDFFVRSTAQVEPRGIYRWVNDPKYVLGYSHAYGWALCCFSWTGLLLSLFAHGAILTYNRLVERPHFMAIQAEAHGVSPTVASEEA